MKINIPEWTLPIVNMAFTLIVVIPVFLVIQGAVESMIRTSKSLGFNFESFQQYDSISVVAILYIGGLISVFAVMNGVLGIRRRVTIATIACLLITMFALDFLTSSYIYGINAASFWYSGAITMFAWTPVVWFEVLISLHVIYQLTMSYARRIVRLKKLETENLS